MGIGETARYALDNPADAPRAGDCDAPRTLARKLSTLREWLAAEFAGQGYAGAARIALEVPPVADLVSAYQAFAARVRLVSGEYLALLLHEGPAVLEGAQGVLLDEWHGFHPYTTWSTTTFENAEALLAEAGMAALRLGVVRCYMTRHGPGPLVTEDPTLELPDRHNTGNEWQGPFRVGHFDAVALRYAIDVCGGVDGIALTHLDVAERQPLRLCREYLVDGGRLDRLPVSRSRDLSLQERLTGMLLRSRPSYTDIGGDWTGAVSAVLGAPVAVESTGPTALDKRPVAAPAAACST
jgi:adenylosuccinate synthase